MSRLHAAMTLAATLAAVVLLGCRYREPDFDPATDRLLPELAGAVAEHFGLQVGQTTISRDGALYLEVPDSGLRALPERQQRDSMDRIAAWAWYRAEKRERVRMLVFCCASGMHADLPIVRVYPKRPARAAVPH